MPALVSVGNFSYMLTKCYLSGFVDQLGDSLVTSSPSGLVPPNDIMGRVVHSTTGFRTPHLCINSQETCQLASRPCWVCIILKLDDYYLTLLQCTHSNRGSALKFGFWVEFEINLALAINFMNNLETSNRFSLMIRELMSQRSQK